MAEKIIAQENTIVKKSNILSRASWKPESVWESRIVAIVAAQVRDSHDGFHDYEIPVKDLLKTAGLPVTGGQRYKDLARLAHKIMSRIVCLKDGRSWTKYTVFSKCAYTEGSGKLIVQFHPDLKPDYLELKRHFTTFRLSEYLSLPSVYSQRIYEILRSWDDCVVTEIGLAALHEMLRTPPSMRKKFGMFRIKVLKKAHKDITRLTRMRFEWEAVTKSGRPLKSGRPVAKIRFFMCLSSMAGPEPEIDPAAKQDFVRALAGCGVAKKTARNLTRGLEAQNRLAEAAALLPELKISWATTGKGALARYVVGTLRKKYLQKPAGAGVADHEDAAVSFARTLQSQCGLCVDDAMEITRELEAQNELAAAAAILPEVKKSWKKTGGKTLADHVLGGLKQKFLQHSEDGK